MRYTHRAIFYLLFLVITLLPVMAAPKAESDLQTEQQTPVVVPEDTMTFKKLGMTEFPEPMNIPLIELESADGKMISTEDYKGKIVFLNFWATWCPPCRMEMPSMETLYKELEQENFVILAISVGEDPASVTEFLRENPHTFPVALNPDNRFGSMFAGRGIPTTYILNKEGKAIAGIIGAREWDDPQTIDFFRSLSRK